jgi:hypothetical protein
VVLSSAGSNPVGPRLEMFLILFHDPHHHGLFDSRSVSPAPAVLDFANLDVWHPWNTMREGAKIGSLKALNLPAVSRIPRCRQNGPSINEVGR